MLNLVVPVKHHLKLKSVLDLVKMVKLYDLLVAVKPQLNLVYTQETVSHKFKELLSNK